MYPFFSLKDMHNGFVSWTTSFVDVLNAIAFRNTELFSKAECSFNVAQDQKPRHLIKASLRVDEWRTAFLLHHQHLQFPKEKLICNGQMLGRICSFVWEAEKFPKLRKMLSNHRR